MLDLPDDAELILCDVWGVLHDGFPAFPAALAALARWRGEGRTVVLVSNSPRPSAVIARQLTALDLPPERYDALVTSGDTGLALVAELGQTCTMIGTASDRAALAEAGFATRATEQAPVVVCTGFDESRPDAADYDPELSRMLERGALLACFNPDRVVVHRGVRELCAGTIADRYAAMGGRVVFTGKPFAPIYDRAFAVASERRGHSFDRSQAVAIGDGIATDMAGAARYGLRFVFVGNGVERGAIAEQGLERVLEDAAWHHDFASFRPMAIVATLS